MLCLQRAVASSYGVVIVQASMLCVAVSFEHAATWILSAFAVVQPLLIKGAVVQTNLVRSGISVFSHNS